jgi:hypothetical protein
MTEPQPPQSAPEQSPLRLRPTPYIALAFGLGPAAGLTVLWLLQWLAASLDPGRRESDMPVEALLLFYVYLLVFGGAVCLVFELLFVAPLLAGFSRYRWRWLNGWTGALIGFALGFLPALAIALVAPIPDETLWGHPVRAAGQLTATGWLGALAGCSAVGMVGLTAAAVFRLLAVRREDGAP